MDVNFSQMLTRPRVFPLHHNGRGRVNTLKGYTITNRSKSKIRIAAYVALRGEYYRLKLKGELIFGKEDRLFRPPIPYSLLTHV